MPFKTKAGTITEPSTTGNQTVTIGFQPKVVLLVATENSIDGFIDGFKMCFGAFDGTDQFVVSSSSDPSFVIVNSARKQRTTSCVLIHNGNGGILSEAAGSSFSSTTFVLNWTNVTGSNIKISYLALGGDSLSSIAIGSFDKSGKGLQSVSGVGFSPDAILFASMNGSTTSLNSSSAGIGLGATTGVTEEVAVACENVSGQDNRVTFTTPKRQQRTDRCIITRAGITSASLSSFDSNGFTISWDESTGSSLGTVHYVAMMGGNFKAGSFLSPATTGIQEISTGFSTEGIMFLSFGRTAVTGSSTRIEFDVGFASNPLEQAYHGIGESTSFSPSGVVIPNRQFHDSTEILEYLTFGQNFKPTIDTRIEYVGKTSSGFKINYTLNGEVNQEGLFLAVGKAFEHSQAPTV